ncbi:unnamed protein product, partial [Tuber aestivum]
MALPPSSGIYFFHKDDVPPPGDPICDLRRGQPRFAGGVGVNGFYEVPVVNSPQRATQPDSNFPQPAPPERQQVFLPIVQISFQCQILATSARTTLTQVFYHPGSRPISEATYTFPLRVITGVVKPKEVAKQTYERANRSGKMAGLLEYNTPDVFTTSIGNVPAGVK